MNLHIPFFTLKGTDVPSVGDKGPFALIPNGYRMLPSLPPHLAVVHGHPQHPRPRQSQIKPVSAFLELESLQERQTAGMGRGASAGETHTTPRGVGQG